MKTEGNKRKTVKEEEANMVRKTVKYVKNFEEGRGEEGICGDTGGSGIGGGGSE